MANTITLQNTLNWCGPFVNYQPLTIGGMEPALTTAQIVMQTILGPPFRWRWNRATLGAPILLDTTHQDYSSAIADFGFAEKGWLQTTALPATTFEVEIKNLLAVSSEQMRPRYFGALLDDNAGNITMRFNTLPEAGYNFNLLYQKKCPLLTSMACSWRPIPDELSHIYQWGFLALISIVVNDSRFPIYNQRFVSHLLGAQDGLDAQQRNIFLGRWEDITLQMQRAVDGAKQGVAARQLG